MTSFFGSGYESGSLPGDHDSWFFLTHETAVAWGTSVGGKLLSLQIVEVIRNLIDTSAWVGTQSLAKSMRMLWMRLHSRDSVY